MAQTFFIDSDEEIISVIGYLRKSPEMDNCFVFPKRSLVLQSAVNLRLFQREAEKQGKRITIISQDENGRQLAERVGIPTKEYAAEINSLHPAPLEAQVPRMTSPPTLSTQLINEGEGERSPALPPSNHLGSDAFSPSFAAASVLPKSLSLQERATAPEPATTASQNEHRLRIRDASPQYQTSLNSVRNDIKPPVMSAPSRRTQMTESPVSLRQAAPPVSLAPLSKPPVYTPALPPREEASLSPRNERLERFFQREPNGALPPLSPQTGTPSSLEKPSLFPASQSGAFSSSPPAARPQGKQSSFPWKTLTFSFVGLLIVSGIGASVYFLLPKASVLITPHEITHDVEARFEGKTITPIDDQDTGVVPVRKIEKSYTSTVNVEVTGRASSGNHKARGTLVISNEYSSDMQPLIATTRFETSEGKIFRLVESTTVPGMTIVDGKRQPGIVEAIVIADEPGDEYNIAATDFTITGFKGGAKYEKIRAKSSKSFSGGGESEESMPSVTKEDIDSGTQRLKEQAKQDFLSSVEQELLPDERLLADSFEVIDTEAGALPLVGSLAERFDVEGNFTGRAFVVSEKVLKEKLMSQNLPERKGVSFQVTDATLSFESVLPRYDEDQVAFSVRSTLLLSSVIETEKLQAELLGLDENGIKAVLEKHAEIKKIEVNFSPEFLFHNIPQDEKRISVRVISER
jgi:hypothetical protein